MVTESGKLDYWRNYFRSANSDIFDVIEHAILVAATDCATEFRARRDRIAENLFSCRLARCSGCDQVELQVPEREEQDGGVKGGREGDFEKDSKVNSSTNDREDMNRMVNNFSYDEAEALTEEIEEEYQTVGEVLRIKEVIANHHDESDAVLFDSLRRLQLMALSYETLKVTGIGMVVNGLRKHRSKQIRHIVRTLIDGWKVIVDEWVKTTAAIAESTPESLNPSSTLDEEEGLAFPPLDEAAFFATEAGIELSQFFDGMDDDGNLRNNGELNKNGGNGRKPISENSTQQMRKLQQTNSGEFDKNGEYGRRPIPENPSKPMRKLPQQLSIPEDKGQMTKQDVTNKQTKQQEALDGKTKQQEAFNKPIKQQEAFNKQNKLSGIDSGSGPGRPPKPQETALIQKKPQEKCKYSDAAADRKLEAAKRRLHEGYLLAENAKKQRTIQVMELHDLPKQGLLRQRPLKPGIQNRRWANGRR